MKPVYLLDSRFHKPWLLVCRVRILIVIDGSGSFSETDGFGLGQILNILDDDPWLRVTFDVTKAHRGGSAESGVTDNFRFDTHDLTQYSQIWLFGVERTANSLSPTELKDLAQFMDNGGGVFATGDHENLGQAMCAEVPRVRSMRRWYYPNAGPNGEPVAPEQTGPDRHDTVMLPGDQSDAVPQPIRLRYYTRTSGGGIVRKVATFPHPVLCGPDGPITYLPDHMHEGLCEVPANLARTWTFDGYNCVEYPTKNGHQEAPQVIAWATDRNSGGGEFGVLAAYDGHKVDKGRVFVDATWHHWFNINLEGLIAATSGPTPDPVVVPKWEAIKAYFRNVALWLAPPRIQNCFRNTSWIFTLRYYDVLMTYKTHLVEKDILGYYWQMGVFARDAMGLLASRCQTTRWVIELLEKFHLRFDPWPPFPNPPWPDPPPWLDVLDLENVVLGGAIHELMNRHGSVTNTSELVERGGQEILTHAQKGAAIALAEFFKRYQHAGVEASQFLKRLPKNGATHKLTSHPPVHSGAGRRKK